MEPPRLYVFNDGTDLYVMYSTSVSRERVHFLDDNIGTTGNRHEIFKAVGFEGVSVPLEMCSARATAFFTAIIDGESLRDVFERRGHY